jgi:MFS family permease
MDRIGEAFVWPFRDPKWVEKVVIMGLILLIPIVGWIIGTGWMLASLARLREGDEELPPANFDYLWKGFQLFLVGLVYSLALTAVAMALFLPGLVLLSTQSGSSGNTVLALAGLLLMLVAFGITVILFLLWYLVYPAIVLATYLGGIAGGFDVAAIARRVRTTPTNALIAGLMLLAAGFIGSLGTYACVVGIVFTIPYSLAMQAWIVRSYEVGSNPQEELNVGQPAAPAR